MNTMALWATSIPFTIHVISLGVCLPPTFSLYWRLLLSRLWMMLVACPRIRAKQVAPAIMDTIVSQRSVMF